MESRQRFLRTPVGAGIAGICRGEQAFSVPVVRTKTKLATVPVFVGRKRIFVVDTGAPSTMIASEASERRAPDDFQARGTPPAPERRPIEWSPISGLPAPHAFRGEHANNPMDNWGLISTIAIWIESTC